MSEEPFISDWFHEASKNKKLDTNKDQIIPKSWIDIHFKSYPRMQKIDLNDAVSVNIPLSKVLLDRKSERKFNRHILTRTELSTLLKLSCGINKYESKDYSRNSSRRTYPSAGARYPIETYLILCHSEIPAGIYHYNVEHHSLELLGDYKESDTRAIFFEEKDGMVQNSSVIFVYTAVFNRTQIKYGERGYRYALLETGHLAQNLVLTATALGLLSCTYGGFYDDLLDKLLGLKGMEETVLYSVFVGK